MNTLKIITDNYNNMSSSTESTETTEISETIDTNIDNYNVMEIFEILNLPDPNIFNVKDKANDIIARMEREGKIELKEFFEKARDKAVKALEEPEEYIEEQDTINDIWKMNSTGVKPTPQQSNVDYFSNISHTVAERPTNSLGDIATGPPVIASHIISIDSQYRTTILPYVDNPLSASYNTSFTFSLSNPITKAISIRLYSYQLPTSWYAFNTRSGNTFFIYNGIIVNIPDGNYSPDTLVSTINDIASQNVSTSSLTLSYNSVSRKITFTNNDTLSDYITVTFFIQENVINYNNCGYNVLSDFQTLGINTTLGWLLGFHLEPDTNGNVSFNIYPGAVNSVTGNSPVDVYGPKYFILSLEDYTSRLSAGLYNITNTKNARRISIPDFYKTIHIDCKTREGSLTRAQKYSIDAVKESSNLNNNTSSLNNKLSGPTSGSAFAIIPLQGITNLRPEPYMKFGNDVEVFKRNYASAVVLDRFTVRLTDDKGNLVNLNDNDWSFSLIVEERLN